jgi:quinol monooxygenase YgiN
MECRRVSGEEEEYRLKPVLQRGHGKGAMEMDFFARFVVREGMEEEAEKALRAVLGPSREESGCVRIEAYRARRGGRVFYIHSTWKDEAAFEYHATLPHTVKFLEQMKKLLEREADMTPAERLD